MGLCNRKVVQSAKRRQISNFWTNNIIAIVNIRIHLSNWWRRRRRRRSNLNFCEMMMNDAILICLSSSMSAVTRSSTNWWTFLFILRSLYHYYDIHRLHRIGINNIGPNRTWRWSWFSWLNPLPCFWKRFDLLQRSSLLFQMISFQRWSIHFNCGINIIQPANELLFKFKLKRIMQCRTVEIDDIGVR